MSTTRLPRRWPWWARASVPCLFALLLLAACGDAGWRTRDIEDRLPPLQLRLSGTTAPSPLTEADLAGRVVLLAFGFMSCPDVCPTTLARLAEAKRSLPRPQAERLRIVFVSVDPARDDPVSLAAYAGRFDEAILGVTGTPGELRALARRYRTAFGYGPRDEHGHYDVSHPAGVYVFDAQGRARLLFRTDDPAEAMRADLARLLGEAG